MKLQDCLHYYMGCKFITDNSEGEVNTETLRFIYPMIEKGHNVQLVLRKLDDITDEEIKSVAALCFGSEDFIITQKSVGYECDGHDMI